MANQKKIFAVTLIGLLGVFFLGFHFYKKAETQKAESLVAQKKESLVRDYSPAIGNKLLRVTVVEFLDPECEACAYFHPIVKGILEKHEGKIHYVVRYAPFHPNSKFAIRVLEGAREQGKYWETLDLLFENLPKWGDHHNPQPELIWTFLPSLGLDVEKIKSNMDSEKTTRMIEQEIRDLETFGVRKTPTFFINGKLLESLGPQQIAEAIQAELK